ncbi:hypothetical protein E0H26_06105 [Micromonospora zingiberis]|uniref:Thioredoxin domain-containing protein n=1 Tax=Micromonospora zingiberis TaxID=2053011 RepID=A0A4R0GQE0_9ACTN|nr:hypothetical protein [Micromonospora zingiberis]TCB98982.1 hypothetical protein E0H26_06105 [Micromonospora zingiberis]
MGKADADGPGLPDLPPEWGRLVVPDDASALAEEAEQLRRELRLRVVRQPRRWRPFTVPVLVLLIAVIAAVAGLATVTWTRAGRTPGPAASGPDPAPAPLTGRALPALDLVDAGQSPVPLRGLLPAVVLLVDGCACPQRVAEAAAAAPAGVSVVTVTAGSPPTAPVETDVLALGDPAGGLRAFLHLPVHPDAVTVLLADRSGRIVLVVAEVHTIADYQAELATLAG